MVSSPATVNLPEFVLDLHSGRACLNGFSKAHLIGKDATALGLGIILPERPHHSSSR
jgi:hypothetical protein